MNARLTQPKVCIAEGCVKNATRKGLCQSHYMRAWSEGRYTKRRLPVICDLKDCLELATIRGMCSTHYSRISQVHKLRTNATFRAYRLGHVKAYQKANPEKRASTKTRSARLTGWPGNLLRQCEALSRRRQMTCDLDDTHILELWEKQGGLCHWLGIPMIPSVETRNPLRPSVDRLVPEKGYTKGNVVLTTQFANLGRNACPADRFAEVASTIRTEIRKR